MSIAPAAAFARAAFDRLPQAGRAAGGALAALALRGTGSVMALAIFSLAARAMTAEEFGRLAIWFNTMAFLSVAAVLGQDTLIARSWGEYCGDKDVCTARAAYRAGWRVTLLSGAAAAVLLLLGGWTIGVPRSTLYAGAAFLFMQTQLHYASSATRVIAGFLASEVSRDAIWRLALLAAVGWGAWSGGMTLATFFWAAALGMVPAIALQLYAVHLRVDGFGVPLAHEEPRTLSGWRMRAGPMWISAVIEGASQYADVMLIGLVASPAVAGEYFAATRIANVFMMLTSGLGAYVGAHGANLYFAGRIAELQKIFKAVGLVALALAGPLLLLIVFFGPQILSLYGARYAASYPTLLTLSLAVFIVAMCGLAPGVLLVTGLERLYARVALIATALRLFFSAALAAAFGAVGAAMGFALIAAPVSIGLVVLCRRLRGLDPSVFSILSTPNDVSSKAKS